MTADELEQMDDRALAYQARQARIAHPRGTFDRQKRFFPNVIAEGGAPNVRQPSIKFPLSLMNACRTKKWCDRLPAETAKQDADKMRLVLWKMKVNHQ